MIFVCLLSAFSYLEKKPKKIICNKLLSGNKMAFEYHLKSMGSYDTIKSKIEKKL